MSPDLSPSDAAHPGLFAQFPVIGVDRVVRRTLFSAGVVAVVGAAVAIIVGQPLVAPGLVLGLALALFNHRVFQSSAMRFTSAEGTVRRKPFAGSVFLRLGLCTGVAIAALVLERPVGWGVIGGLAVFQALLLLNAVVALIAFQRAEGASMLDGHLLAVANIPVGDHITRHGLDIDTIYTTVFAAVVVIALGLYVRSRATAGVPSKPQVFWEFVVGAVGDQVESSLGPKYRRVVPLGVTIFVLVLAADWVEVLPGLYHNTDFAPSPSADVNLCYAIGILVFVLTNVAGIRARGVGGYFRHFVRPPKLMTPLHILEELVKPITLALRLFGNIFAGGIMIALLLSFPIKLGGLGIGYGVVSAVLTVVWKLFDMFIGVIQAFIFALLTILYYQFATETEGAH